MIKEIFFLAAHMPGNGSKCEWKEGFILVFNLVLPALSWQLTFQRRRSVMSLQHTFALIFGDGYLCDKL